MPAKSEAQRRTAGAALSVKRGKQKLSDLPPGLRKVVESMLSMSEEELEDFARKPKKHSSRHRVTSSDKVHKFRST